VVFLFSAARRTDIGHGTKMIWVHKIAGTHFIT
jgi:hypothetical protein